MSLLWGTHSHVIRDCEGMKVERPFEMTPIVNNITQ